MSVATGHEKKETWEEEEERTKELRALDLMAPSLPPSATLTNDFLVLWKQISSSCSAFPLRRKKLSSFLREKERDSSRSVIYGTLWPFLPGSLLGHHNF